MTPLQTQFPITFITPVSSLYDWHVDSVNGDDGNAGTRAAPFKTLAALPTLEAGDRIGLKCGSWWRETLAIEVDNVVVGNYSTGADPKIDCADIIPNASFAKTEGQANVYEVEISPEVDGTGKTFVRCWEDGANLTLADDLATCDATPGSYYVTSHTTIPLTLYVHPTDSTSPVSDSKLYEYPQRQYAIDAINADGVQVSYVETTRNLHNNGSVAFARSPVLRFMTFSDGTVHNAYVGDGALLEDCLATGKYYPLGTATLYVFNENTPASLGVTFRRCRAVMDTYDATTTGFFGHRNVSGDFGTVRYEDCEVDNCNIAFAGSHAAAMVLTNPITTNCPVSLRCANAINYTVSNPQFEATIAGVAPRNIETAVAGATISITGGSIAADAPSSGNVAALNNDTTIILEDVSLTITNGTSATGNVFTNTGLSGLSLTYNNCRFVTNAGQNLRLLTAPTLGASNDNCFDRAGVFNSRFGGTTYSTIADWRMATSQDADSTVGDCAA